MWKKNINTLIKRTIIAAFAVVMTVLSPITTYAFDEMFTIGNEIYYYNPDDRCVAGETSVSTVSDFSGKVKIAQANIKQHAEDVKSVLVEKNDPDFIVLSESGYRSKAQLTPTGYSFFRDTSGNNQGDSTSVLWKTDLWKKVDSGRVLMVEDGPQEWDAGRSSNWVSLQNNSGAIISVMSVHHMINPNKYPIGSSEDKANARAKRQQLYGEGMDKLAEKARELSALGPVIAAGDFNYQISDDDSYGPRKKLAAVNMQSTHDELGRLSGAAVDYIFYTKTLKADNHSLIQKGTGGNSSDHPYLFATLSANGNTGTSGGVVDSGGCVCKDPNASTSSLVGNKNDEKVYNYFIAKGLSPVQAAGIAGNMAIESGFDPERIQGKDIGDGSKDPNDAGSSGWGLIQWTPGSKVIIAAKQAGLEGQPIYELSTQLDLVWGHMQNKPPITKGSFSIPEYKKITDVEKAVNYFEDKIEGAGEPNYPDRYQAARLALEEYGEGSSTSSASSAAQTSVSNCDSIDSGAAAGNAVQTAINYAWSDYRPKGSAGALTLKPSYKKAVEQAQAKHEYVGGRDYPGVDCGGFITLAMKNSGVDPKYGAGGNTDTQLNYLLTSGKYKEIKDPTTADMVPGAIAIKAGADDVGHTYMYVGENPGFETKVASASLDGRAPMAGMEVAADNEYRWFILK